MKKAIIGVTLALMLVAIILSMSIHKEKILIVEDQGTGAYKEFFPKDNQFELSYIHSVLLTPADEYFVITDDNKLLLQMTIYESFGVGLPFEQAKDSDFEIVDGKFILHINREIDVLNMVISPIPKHSITVNGENVRFLDLFDEEVATIKIYAVEKEVFSFNRYHIVF